MEMREAWQMFLRLRGIVFDTTFIVPAIKRKEIAIQDDADAFQQAGVNALSLEYVVHIGSVAVQLSSQPRHTTFLAMQLCFNLFTDMNCHYRASDTIEQYLPSKIIINVSCFKFRIVMSTILFARQNYHLLNCPTSHGYCK
jgi:hypothetical protein